MSVCYPRLLDNSIPPAHKKETKSGATLHVQGPSCRAQLEMPLRVAMLKAGAIDRASSTRRLLAAQACSRKSQAMCSHTGHQWSQASPPPSPAPLVFLSSACHNVRLVCHVYLIDREREGNLICILLLRSCIFCIEIIQNQSRSLQNASQGAPLHSCGFSPSPSARAILSFVRASVIAHSTVAY